MAACLKGYLSVMGRKIELMINYLALMFGY